LHRCGSSPHAARAEPTPAIVELEAIFLYKLGHPNGTKKFMSQILNGRRRGGEPVARHAHGLTMGVYRIRKHGGFGGLPMSSQDIRPILDYNLAVVSNVNVEGL